MQVEPDWHRGNHYKAQNASHQARKWGIASIITGVVFSVVILIIVLVPSVVSVI